MEKEEDDPYDFDKKFEMIDNQLQEQEKRRTQQYKSTTNEEDYFTFDQNKEKIMNIPESSQQSVYAPTTIENQTGTLPAKDERQSASTVNSDGQETLAKKKEDPPKRISQIMHRVHQGVFDMMSQSQKVARESTMIKASV